MPSVKKEKSDPFFQVFIEYCAVCLQNPLKRPNCYGRLYNYVFICVKHSQTVFIDSIIHLKTLPGTVYTLYCPMIHSL